MHLVFLSITNHSKINDRKEGKVREHLCVLVEQLRGRSFL